MFILSLIFSAINIKLLTFSRKINPLFQFTTINERMCTEWTFTLLFY